MSKMTANDISHLYNSLQQLGEQVKNGSLDSDTKFIPSPSTSTPIHSDSSSSTPIECSCIQVLDVDNLSTCLLCQSPIPIVQQLTAEKATYEQEIIDLQNQLLEEQQKIDLQIQSIDELNNQLDTVMNKLDDKTTIFQTLQNEMELLNEKYVDEIERVAEIQHSKDMVENELEDLSRHLFEEANTMVANEKRTKHNLEIQQKHLENQLTETRERLAAEQMQLTELKQRMDEMKDVIVPKTPDHIKDMTTLLAERNHHAPIDNLQLDEFQEFVRSGTSISLKKIHTNSFMKNCQEEDVESCLRFSRLSARKLNEAIVMNTCFIEESPPGFATEQAKRSVAELKISAAKSLMWERFNQTTVFDGCQACGRQDGTALPYRFRISYFDDWACIDRFCRDRLVAVCEFYVLIRNIRQGLYSNRSIPDLYHEAMRLRLQMFYARYTDLMISNLG